MFVNVCLLGASQWTQINSNVLSILLIATQAKLKGMFMFAKQWTLRGERKKRDVLKSG
jgi:hypothetical protein